MEVDANGLEVLDAEECLRLLGTKTLGRIGVSIDALPAVLPVNSVLDGDQVIIRTSRGTKLSAATRHNIVAFEVDDIDPPTGIGWSVMVRGLAREISDPPDLLPGGRVHAGARDGGEGGEGGRRSARMEP